MNDGGEVQTGTGVLTLGGNVTVLSNANLSVISGNLSLGSVTRTFTLHGRDYVWPVLDLLANVRDSSGTAGINWVGRPVEDPVTHGWELPGVNLRGSNSYGGLTLATNAYLYVYSPFSLGNTNQGTTVCGVGLTLLNTSTASVVLKKLQTNLERSFSLRSSFASRAVCC